MAYFGSFYLDQEKDLVVTLDLENGEMTYELGTPNHGTGNLIRNLARLCGLPLEEGADGRLVIRGTLPCYVDGRNRKVYIMRMGGMKVANVYPDGEIDEKISFPAIARTLMSQTKDYRGRIPATLVKAYLFEDCKFHTDLHTHMNANLPPDILIALGIHHQIRYPYYYVRKLGLRLTPAQEKLAAARRRQAEAALDDPALTGKYRTRAIDDHTYLNFADLILNNPDSAYNIPKIRASLAVRKDGQAVFSDLEKVYLYRYVFTKGVPAEDPIALPALDGAGGVDADILRFLRQMEADRKKPEYAEFSLFQDTLLWIARNYRRFGIDYAEISDTALVKKASVPEWLAEVHRALPAVQAETGVTLRFLAGLRRIPLAFGPDPVSRLAGEEESLRVLRAIAGDPWVAGSDILGEEVNDIRDLQGLIAGIVKVAADEPDFVVRIHAGENDCLRDNVDNAVRCVKNALAPGQAMPRLRIGHGLYTANLTSAKGKQLIRDLIESRAVLEFQITSNVRLNNLSDLKGHPLKQYLRAGVYCVQGTDGGAMYGTNAIDEQLALANMLGLTHKELLAMRRAENAVREDGLADFARKKARFEAAAGPDPDVAAWYRARIRASLAAEEDLMGTVHGGRARVAASEVLADRIAVLPVPGADTAGVPKERLAEAAGAEASAKIPVIVAGGSFNSSTHNTRLRADYCRMIDTILEKGDPEKMFFVIGPAMKGYERYLAEQNLALGEDGPDGARKGKFELFAIVPSLLTQTEARRLREAGVWIRVAIDPYEMGIYKSFGYEIFKRGSSVMIAFDGNTAAMNLIQEARNARKRRGTLPGKQECRIFVNANSRMLKAKASSLQGYVTLFGAGRPASPEAAADRSAAQILRDVRKLEAKQAGR